MNAITSIGLGVALAVLRGLLTFVGVYLIERATRR